MTNLPHSPCLTNLSHKPSSWLSCYPLKLNLHLLLHDQSLSTTETSGGEAELKTNFVSDKPSSWFSEMYKRDGLSGGHVIMLGSDEASK